MVLTSQQASETLDEVAAAQRKAYVLQGYAKGAPHFFLWGLIWAVGYAGTALFPALSGKLWLVLDVIGVGRQFPDRTRGLRSGGQGKAVREFPRVVLGFIAFWGATFYVLQPQTTAQYGAFPALLMAFIYTCVGAFAGARWLVIGVAMWALTVGGYVLVPAHFMLWMAIVGGRRPAADRRLDAAGLTWRTSSTN